MDIKAVKEISARELLLSPMHLLHQLSAGLLPGVLVLFIVMIKHSPLIPAALSVTSMLGYKTKIGLSLLIALVIGRVVQSAALIIAKLFGWVAAKASERQRKRNEEATTKKAEDAASTVGESNSDNTAPAAPEILPPHNGDVEKPPEPANNNPAKLTSQQEIARHFLSGLLAGTVVAKDSSTFDSWEANRAHLGLILSSGCVLFVASFYQGDGLRLYEFVAGVLLIVMGYSSGERTESAKDRIARKRGWAIHSSPYD